MKAQICPLCQGRGTVPGDFYTDLPVLAPTKCRSCMDGIVFVPENPSVVAAPPYECGSQEWTPRSAGG